MPPLRFATFLARSLFPLYQFVADDAGHKLGCPTELRVGESFEQFGVGDVDVGFICGLPYVQLARQQPPPVELLATPVLLGERFAGRPIYFSDVIVQKDSPYQTFADLQGCSWAYNEVGSHSGYNVVGYYLSQRGADWNFFSRRVKSGAHLNSIQMVAAGQVAAAAIDCQVLAIARRDQPELTGQLRVIEALGPSPGLPVVAARHMPASLKHDIRAVLLAMAHDPAAQSRLAEGLVERFAPITDADYDVTRQMLAAAEASAVS